MQSETVAHQKLTPLLRGIGCVEDGDLGTLCPITAQHTISGMGVNN
jgi:hypothetical protein